MTYEYVCEACGHQWEAEQSIKDRPLKNCVSCGEDKAKRLVSGGTGFLLKGGGWYADLYSSPGSAAKSGGSEDKGTKANADSAATKSAGESKSSESSTPASTSTSSPSTTSTTSTTSAGTAKAS